jgi:flagellin
MTSINTNTASTIAANALYKNERKMGVAMERLSTGLRINSAKDDAAGLAIAKKMSAQISGLRQASRNANDGIAMLQTFEGASGEITSMLNRMRDLKIQALNGTYTAADRANLGEEYNSLKSEIARTVNDTQWNTRNLMTGGSTVSLMIGANAGQNMDVVLNNWSQTVGTSSAVAPANRTTANAANGANAETQTWDLDTVFAANGLKRGQQIIVNDNEGSGASIKFVAEADIAAANIAQAIVDKYGSVGVFDLSVSNGDLVLTDRTVAHNAARAASTIDFVQLTGTGVTVDEWSYSSLDEIDKAITNATSERSKYGAYISRLEKTSDNLLNVALNTDASRGQIEDADYAAETTELARTQIIAQAGTAMLAQANQIKQTVLALLQ